jgi:hypothetical protein
MDGYIDTKTRIHQPGWSLALMVVSDNYPQLMAPERIVLSWHVYRSLIRILEARVGKHRVAYTEGPCVSRQYGWIKGDQAEFIIAMTERMTKLTDGSNRGLPWLG